jgi:hypothetical protein
MPGCRYLASKDNAKYLAMLIPSFLPSPHALNYSLNSKGSHLTHHCTQQESSTYLLEVEKEERKSNPINWMSTKSGYLNLPLDCVSTNTGSCVEVEGGPSQAS